MRLQTLCNIDSVCEFPEVDTKFCALPRKYPYPKTLFWGKLFLLWNQTARFPVSTFTVSTRLKRTCSHTPASNKSARHEINLAMSIASETNCVSNSICKCGLLDRRPFRFRVPDDSAFHFPNSEIPFPSLSFRLYPFRPCPIPNTLPFFKTPSGAATLPRGMNGLRANAQRTTVFPPTSPPHPCAA